MPHQHHAYSEGGEVATLAFRCNGWKSQRFFFSRWHFFRCEGDSLSKRWCGMLKKPGKIVTYSRPTAMIMSGIGELADIIPSQAQTPAGPVSSKCSKNSWRSLAILMRVSRVANHDSSMRQDFLQERFCWSGKVWIVPLIFFTNLNSDHFEIFWLAYPKP